MSQHKWCRYQAYTGVVNVLPVPSNVPPVAASYHLRVAPLPSALKLTVPPILINEGVVAVILDGSEGVVPETVTVAVAEVAQTPAGGVKV
jgi:hypothetical protein